MKKIATIFGAFAIASTAIGQQANIPLHSNAKQSAKHQKVYFTGNEFSNYLNVSTNPSRLNPKNRRAANLSETKIGETSYDLQSNNSVQNRHRITANGSLAGTWTSSNSLSLAAPDRGTGYNTNISGGWGAPTSARQESVRTGWSSHFALGNGSEVFLAHPGVGSILMARRTTPGTGTWIESTVPSNAGLNILWPRACAGGADGNTIHMVALTAPVANQGALYQGLDGALLYFRSQDGGNTWDIKDSVLPQLSVADFNGFTADEYAITARGNTIVIAVFGGWKDSFILKSTDNGNTWTKTLTYDFPLTKYVIDAGYDLNGDGTAEQLETSDQSGTVIVDANGMAHVFFGRMVVLDDDLTDGSSSYFPGTNGLFYWNETKTEPTIITGAPDLNGNDTLDLIDPAGAAIPRYFMSQSSFANAGISADGRIFLSFSACVETLDNGLGQNYRHIFIIYSNDNGNTWSQPKDVTPDDDFAECVFGTMAPLVNQYVHLIYQRDDEPGLSVRGDEDAYRMNDIVYLRVDTAFLSISSVNVNELANQSSVEIYPNPAKNFVTVSGMTNTQSIQIFDLSGKLVKTQSVNNLERAVVNTNDLNKGVYFVNIIGNNAPVTKKLIIQ
jgi:hypothetical protein